MTSLTRGVQTVLLPVAAVATIAAAGVALLLFTMPGSRIPGLAVAIPR
jgi:hypothetical protein